MTADSTPMTIRLPSALIEAADRAIRAGLAPSRDDLIATALCRELDEFARDYQFQRAVIDAAFLRMGQDSDVRDEALRIDREFRAASWEALDRRQDD